MASAHRARHANPTRGKWRWLPLLVVLAMTTTAAAAAQPDQAEPNVYTGCLNSGGSISNVAVGDQPAKPCKNDLQISWNEQGIQGETGATGPAGPAGPQGIRGETGATGPEGPAGEPGLDGAPGPQGEPGVQGIPGEAGPKGDQGEQGVPGPQGDQGIQGETGATGPEGPAGPQGVPGPEGPQGLQGEQGIQGIPGEPGVFGFYRRYALKESDPIYPGQALQAEAVCDEGDIATGGGFSVANADVVYSAPSALVGAHPTGWLVAGKMTSGSPTYPISRVDAHVVCADLTP